MTAEPNQGGWKKADWRRLRVGQRVRATALHGQDAVAVRLMEMGMLPGVEFTYLGKAPLGDPLLIEIYSGKLSVRLAEAAGLEIEALE